jgi:condensin complex subunit 1
LNYTEKSLKKLSDLFKFYKDAIADETVYESLLSIAAKCRKFAKQEIKVVLDEFEAKITNCFNTHKENNTVISKAKQTEKKTEQKSNKNKTRVSALSACVFSVCPCPLLSSFLHQFKVRRTESHQM